MRYLKEIIKASRNHKKLPSFKKLLKQYGRWKFYHNKKDSLKNGLPWITFSSIEFLEENLKPGMRVFEYGGGGSTIFFSRKVQELITVEHDKDWFDALSKTMGSSTKAQWKGLFIEPQKQTSQLKLDPSNPAHYFSDDENFRSSIFLNYASAIDVYPDEYFDVVLVDGRARPSCLFHSLDKVKNGGFLVLDNSDRAYYLSGMKGKLEDYEMVVNDFGPTPYIGWFTQTSIWKRKDPIKSDSN